MCEHPGKADAIYSPPLMAALARLSFPGKFAMKSPTRGLALDLTAGDDHYRAYVGPPWDYDLISAMVFNLLTCAGLRLVQHTFCKSLVCA